MEISPLAEWPFWHYFTLHMQNIIHVTDDFRKTSPSPVVMSEQTPIIKDTIAKSFAYDFMNDTIIPLSDVNQSLLMVVPINKLTDTRIIALKNTQGMLFVAKGVFVPDKNAGGELIPLIGTYDYTAAMVKSLISIVQYANGAKTTYTAMNDLISPQAKANVSELLKRPVYDNNMIRVLLSMRIPKGIALPPPVVAEAKDTGKVEKRIAKAIAQPMTEAKAINVSTGAVVSTNSKGYTIAEYEVIVPETGIKRTIKFAFKAGMNEADRQAYIERLHALFKAVPTSTTERITASREERILQPIRMDQASYRLAFSGDEGFGDYMKNLHAAQHISVPDTSSIIEGVVRVPEEEPEEGEVEYEEEEEEEGELEED